jgi:hypothetical protein
MIGGIEETSASFEARSAPRSYPTEAPFRRPDEYEQEPTCLYAAGLLEEEEEKRELVADWRETFQSAQQPDFFICCGPGDLRRGAAAKRAA